MPKKYAWLVGDGREGFYCADCKTEWSTPKCPHCRAWVGGVGYRLGGGIWALALLGVLCYACFHIIEYLTR